MKTPVTPAEQAAIKDSVLRAVTDLLNSRQALQDLNERVGFPERFNSDASLAAITRVNAHDGKLDFTVTVGSEQLDFTL